MSEDSILTSRLLLKDDRIDFSPQEIRSLRLQNEQLRVMELSETAKQALLKMQRYDRYIFGMESEKLLKEPISKELKRLQKLKNEHKQMRVKHFDNQLTITCLFNHIKLISEMNRQLSDQSAIKEKYSDLQKKVHQLSQQHRKQIAQYKKKLLFAGGDGGGQNTSRSSRDVSFESRTESEQQSRGVKFSKDEQTTFNIILTTIRNKKYKEAKRQIQHFIKKSNKTQFVAMYKETLKIIEEYELLEGGNRDSGKQKQQIINYINLYDKYLRIDKIDEIEKLKSKAKNIPYLAEVAILAESIIELYDQLKKIKKKEGPFQRQYKSANKQKVNQRSLDNQLGSSKKNSQRSRTPYIQKVSEFQSSEGEPQLIDAQIIKSYQIGQKQLKLKIQKLQKDLNEFKQIKNNNLQQKLEKKIKDLQAQLQDKILQEKMTKAKIKQFDDTIKYLSLIKEKRANKQSFQRQLIQFKRYYPQSPLLETFESFNIDLNKQTALVTNLKNVVTAFTQNTWRKKSKLINVKEQSETYFLLNNLVQITINLSKQKDQMFKSVKELQDLKKINQTLKEEQMKLRDQIGKLKNAKTSPDTKSKQLNQSLNLVEIDKDKINKQLKEQNDKIKNDLQILTGSYEKYKEENELKISQMKGIQQLLISILNKKEGTNLSLFKKQFPRTKIFSLFEKLLQNQNQNNILKDYYGQKLMEINQFIKKKEVQNKIKENNGKRFSEKINHDQQIETLISRIIIVFEEILKINQQSKEARSSPERQSSSPKSKFERKKTEDLKLNSNQRGQSQLESPTIELSKEDKSKIEQNIPSEKTAESNIQERKVQASYIEQSKVESANRINQQTNFFISALKNFSKTLNKPMQQLYSSDEGFKNQLQSQFSRIDITNLKELAQLITNLFQTILKNMKARENILRNSFNRQIEVRDKQYEKLQKQKIAIQSQNQQEQKLVQYLETEIDILTKSIQELRLQKHQAEKSMREINQKFLKSKQIFQDLQNQSKLLNQRLNTIDIQKNDYQQKYQFLKIMHQKTKAQRDNLKLIVEEKVEEIEGLKESEEEYIKIKHESEQKIRDLKYSYEVNQSQIESIKMNVSLIIKERENVLKEKQDLGKYLQQKIDQRDQQINEILAILQKKDKQIYQSELNRINLRNDLMQKQNEISLLQKNLSFLQLQAQNWKSQNYAKQIANVESYFKQQIDQRDQQINEILASLQKKDKQIYQSELNSINLRNDLMQKQNEISLLQKNLSFLQSQAQNYKKKLLTVQLEHNIKTNFYIQEINSIKIQVEQQRFINSKKFNQFTQISQNHLQTSFQDHQKAQLKKQLDFLNEQLASTLRHSQQQKREMRKFIDKMNNDLQMQTMLYNQQKRVIKQEIERARNEEYEINQQKIRKLRQDIQVLRQENGRLTAIIDSNQLSFNQIIAQNKEFYQKIQELEQINRELMEEINISRNQKQELIGRLAPLQFKLQQLQGKIIQIVQQKDLTASNQFQKHQRESEEMRNCMNQLNQQRNNLIISSTNQIKQIGTMRGLILNLENELNLVRNTIRQYENKVDDLNLLRKSAVQEKTKLTEVLEEKIKGFQQQIQKMSNPKKQHFSKIDKLTISNLQLEKQKMQIQLLVKQRQMQLNYVTLNSKKQKGYMEEQINYLNQENIKLSKGIEYWKNSMSLRKKQSADYYEQIQLLEEEKKLNTLELMKYRSSNEDLLRQRRNLEVKMEQVQQISAQNKIYQVKINSLESDLSKIKFELKQLETQNIKLKIQNQANTTAAKLAPQFEHFRYKSLNFQKDEEIMTFKSQLYSKQQQIDKLKSFQAELKKDINLLQQKIYRLEQYEVKYSREVSSNQDWKRIHKEAEDRSRRQINTLRSNILEYQTEDDRNKRQIKLLRSKLVEFEFKTKQYETKLFKLQKQVASFGEENKSLKEIIQDLKRQINFKQNQLSKLVLNKQKLRTQEIQRISNENNYLRQIVSQLDENFEINQQDEEIQIKILQKISQEISSLLDSRKQLKKRCQILENQLQKNDQEEIQGELLYSIDKLMISLVTYLSQEQIIDGEVGDSGLKFSGYKFGKHREVYFQELQIFLRDLFENIWFSQKKTTTKYFEMLKDVKFFIEDYLSTGQRQILIKLHNFLKLTDQQ